MHVAVLGAGVTGATAAHYLLRSGHSVTLIDREDRVANATSHANGAQLCYSFTDAMATPRFAARIPGLIVGVDPAIHVKLSIDLDFARWGMSFLAQCTDRRAAENTVDLLQMALRSQSLLNDLRQELPDSFSFRAAGKIVLLRTESDAKSASHSCALKQQHGCDIKIISVEEAINIEPAISRMTGDYVAAIYSPGDEIGDPFRFTSTLTASLQQDSNFNLMLNTQIDALDVKNGEVCAVQTSEGKVEADAVVVCLGVWSGALLKPYGIDTGIYPARGYSVTLPSTVHTPSVSITDLAKRFVISRIDDRTRIAGFADFVGYDTRGDERRVADLMSVASSNAPDVANYGVSQTEAWGGFRPLTASGKPLIGATEIPGLFLNTGHGSLGWTLACVSGQEIANAISQSTEGRRKAA